MQVLVKQPLVALARSELLEGLDRGIDQTPLARCTRGDVAEGQLLGSTVPLRRLMR